jgi:hypothetical protein
MKASPAAVISGGVNEIIGGGNGPITAAVIQYACRALAKAAAAVAGVPLGADIIGSIAAYIGVELDITTRPVSTVPAEAWA